MNKRTKKHLATVLSALIIMLFGALSARYPNVLGTFTEAPMPGTYHVVSVSDGDTIVVAMGGVNEKIRLIGVDTPETHDPRKPVQCFGHAASDFTKKLLSNQKVRLEADSLSSNRDRYNRLLRYVYLPDGTLVNAEIIRGGYGFAYTSFPFTKSDEFKNYENDAKNNQRGLWKDCNVQFDSRGFIHAGEAVQ